MDGYGDGTFGGRFVEGFSEQFGQERDDSIIGEEDVVLGKEFALGFVLLVFLLEFVDADDFGDALGEFGGEGGGRNDIFVGALGVGDDETDGRGGRGIEGVGDGYFGGLELSFVADVFLGSESEPDGCGFCVVVVVFSEEILSPSLFGFFGLAGRDVLEECSGCFQYLLQCVSIYQLSWE